MIDAKSIEALLQRYDAAKTRKQQSDHSRAEAGKYAWPTSQDMYSPPGQSEGSEHTLNIYDFTAIDAGFRLAANIFSYLMPVGSKWFEFIASLYEDNQDSNVKMWLSKATSVTHSEIWRSNFVREMFAAIRSMVVFGTGIISIVKDKDTKELVYRAHHIGDIAFQENSRNIIDTVFRSISYTARHAIQEFGEDKLPKTILDSAKNPAEANKKFEFVHCVCPNADFNSKKITSKKFKSVFIYMADKVNVKEEQFDSNPYFVMRFTVAPGALWGSGPIIELLPEIRMLNQMKFDFNEASELANHPTMIAEDDGVIGQPSTGPRDIVYIRAGSQMPVPWNVGGNLPLTREVIEDQRQVIKDGCFLNIFQTLEGIKNISSATESQIRKQDGLVIVAAVVGATQKDVLDPIIIRSLSLIDPDRLPPAPRKFNLDIVYQGRLAMAMSALQADAIELHMSKWGPYAEIGGLANIKIDQASRMSGLASSVPAEIFMTEDEVAEQNAIAEQERQETLAAENAKNASTALKNAGAPIDETSLAAQL